MVQVGIIGCGTIARTRHIPALRLSPDAQIRGYYNRSPERARDFAATYGGTVYASPEEMLADPQLDAVVICTATRSHCELTVRALEAGKHVLCEKPMAASGEDAQRMIEAGRKSGKKLMIAHNQRLYAPHIKAKELLEQGAIGRLLTFRTFLGIRGPEYGSVRGVDNAYFRRAESGRGVVADVGSHRIDLMRYITGLDYKRIFAYTPTLAKRYPDGGLIDVDDNAITIAEMTGGVVGTIITSWTSMGGNDRMTFLYGTEGQITLYGADCAVKVESLDGSVTRIDFAETPAQDVVLLTEIDQMFIDCILRDTTPFITGEDGLAVIEAIDAMERSHQTGGWVELEDLS